MKTSGHDVYVCVSVCEYFYALNSGKNHMEDRSVSFLQLFELKKTLTTQENIILWIYTHNWKVGLAWKKKQQVYKNLAPIGGSSIQ